MPTRPKVHSPKRRKPKRQPDARPSASRRGYNARWRRLRWRIYQRDRGICRACGRIINEHERWHIDHIVPRRQGGTDDDSNLQLLHEACHNRKTATHDGGWGRKHG